MSPSDSYPVLLVQPYRFTFRCESPAYFPAGTLTNHLRGAFGIIFRRMVCNPGCSRPETCPTAASCPYARLFAPRLNGGIGRPDMADMPRPFVLRASVSDDLHLGAGRTFTVDLHLFDFSRPNLRYFIWAFSQLASEGLGQKRTQVHLEKVERIAADGKPAAVVFDEHGIRPDAESVTLPLCLTPSEQRVETLRLEFLTPTETTHEKMEFRTPYFPAIMARACDRIAALSRFYQGQRLDADYLGLRNRAGAVEMREACLRETRIWRKSRRTGQIHEVGGFLGYADFAGDLAEFVPWLEAAWWTGVGRYTVWGQGAVRIVLPD